MVANGVKNTTTDNGRDELLKEEHKKSARDESQVEVVDEKERLELERLTVAHQLATTKNDSIVDDNEDRSRLEGRHGRLERNELEFINRVADDSSPCLVEDGPQVDAERAIDRRPGELLK